MTWGQERFHRKIVLDSSNNGIVFREGATPYLITLAEGDWYLHADSSLHAAGYKGIYYAIAFLYNGGVDATIGTISGAPSLTLQFAAATPTDSSEQTGRGLQISVLSSTVDILFSNGSFTMDPRWFGWESGAGDETGAGSYTSPMQIRGIFHTYNELDGLATFKGSFPFAELYESGGAPDRAYQKDWITYRVRDYKCEQIPAAHVLDGRAAIQGWATTGAVALGDDHNSLEYLWNSARLGDSILCVYNDVTPDLQIDSHEYDVLKLAPSKHKQEFKSFAQALGQAAEYYTLDTSWFIVQQGFDF